MCTGSNWEPPLAKVSGIGVLTLDLRRSNKTMWVFMWERRLMLLGPHLMSTLQAIEDMKYEIVKYWDWLSVLCGLGYQYPKSFTPQHLNAWKSRANKDQSIWVNIAQLNYAGVLSCDINFLLAVRWITYFIYILKIHTSYWDMKVYNHSNATIQASQVWLYFL